MEFVTFHVALSADQAVHPNQTVAHKEYLAMVDMMFASARLFHPTARRVMLTDGETSFDGISGKIDRLERSDMDAQKLMLERANAQLNHVRSAAFDQPMVILDSDILINGSLESLMQRPFDVALTWRENEAQPINGGLMILNNQRPQAARRFFEEYVRIYRERYADEQAAWFGDQLALRDCVGLALDDMAGRDIVEVHGCRILLLPCDVYNFSPDNRYREIDTELLDKLVLHFKGERKRLMQPFWRAALHPRHSRAPWVQYRAWRERRWLREQLAREAAETGQGARAPREAAAAPGEEGA